MKIMNNKKKTFIAILIIILGVLILNQTSKVSADALPANQGRLLQEQNTVSIYFFWGDGCPHCAVAKPYLQSLGDNNSLIEVFSFEV
ncbi:MAG: hypothetical protein Q8R09_04400, partial [Anaerolineaceae bacterium]|nr:hypothetical protein [Anaerolineaceae bacterium]